VDSGSPAGWYPDPWDPGRRRFWTGTEWGRTTEPTTHPTTPGSGTDARRREPVNADHPGQHAGSSDPARTRRAHPRLGVFFLVLALAGTIVSLGTAEQYGLREEYLFDFLVWGLLLGFGIWLLRRVPEGPGRAECHEDDLLDYLVPGFEPEPDIGREHGRSALGHYGGAWYDFGDMRITTTRQKAEADLKLYGPTARGLRDELLPDDVRQVVLDERMRSELRWGKTFPGPLTLTSRMNLANAHQSAGHLERAIPHHEIILADLQKLLGPHDPQTLTAANNLAGAYESAGDLRRAIGLYEQTLADRQRVLGPDHPQTLTTRNNLASAYQSAGDHERAIPLYDRPHMIGRTTSDSVSAPPRPSRLNPSSAVRSNGHDGIW
jgi:hypothetical protein